MMIIMKLLLLVLLTFAAVNNRRTGSASALQAASPSSSPSPSLSTREEGFSLSSIIWQQQQEQQRAIPFLRHPDFQAFCQGDVPFVTIPDAFLDPALIEDLRLDAIVLRQNGFGATAGIASSGASTAASTAASTDTDTPGEESNGGTAITIRENVHQIWLSSPSTKTAGNNNNSNNNNNSSPLQNVYCGRLEARQSLMKLVAAMKDAMIHQRSTKYGQLGPSIPPELSYLLYESGSYYQKHIDVIQRRGGNNNNVGHHERAVSMILYLGHDTDDNGYYDDYESTTITGTSSRRPYELVKDGGALRIYRQENNNDNNSNNPLLRNPEGRDDNKTVDIAPVANTLVLMDSATVPHEVLETFRSRVCVVGWFHAGV